ncbi:MAG: AAA family ATPase [Bacteroidota bacterium]
MRLYPIGLQDFKKLREGGYLYVDKTRQMYDLVMSGSYYLLPRPRRFGKSLLLSTIKYFFQGREELFEGLWVDQESEHDWKAYPVLHFSFSSIGYKSIGLEKALVRAIDDAAKEHGVTLENEDLPGRFRELIQVLVNSPQKLVILIDEYDKPLTDYLDDLPQAEINRAVLKNFFSVIKDSDQFIRLLLITGVSKFSKVSLFLDLNHLEDLTLNPYGATLTGYTQEELEENFSEEIMRLANTYQMDRDQLLQQIQSWYNGYRWWIGGTLYNPFSILNFFKSGMFRNFWWESGTPTFLLKALKRHNQYDLPDQEVTSVVFESFTLENQDWLALLFQTGYLTLAPFGYRDRVFKLVYPNKEVEETMYQHLLATYRDMPVSTSYSIWLNLRKALDAGNLEEVMKQIDLLFSTIPYQIFDAKKESFFHAILHLTFQGLGMMTQSEVSTSTGRVDTVVFGENEVYVMEFKLDASANAALDQIRAKRYGSPYLGENRPVVAVGISFSSETRTVAEWEAVPYTELLAEG